MLNKLSVAISLLLFAAFVIFLRPALLRGDTTYIMVVGESMEPTISQGDLAIAKARNSYDIGDIVSFYSPYGPIVIHRIVGFDGESFVTQGDNRDSLDPWTVSPDVILGRSLVVIPYVGTLFAALREPIVLALFIGGLFLALTVPDLLLHSEEGRLHRKRKERLRRQKKIFGVR